MDEEKPAALARRDLSSCRFMAVFTSCFIVTLCVRDFAHKSSARYSALFAYIATNTFAQVLRYFLWTRGEEMLLVQHFLYIFNRINWAFGTFKVAILQYLIKF
jgi:hypothetical protein